MFICSEVTLCATLSEYEKKEEGKEESKEVFSKSGDSDACAGKLFAAASKASGEKCLRCWCYSNALGKTDVKKHPKLCERCGPIVLDVAPDLVYHQEASNAEAVGASSS